MNKTLLENKWKMSRNRGNPDVPNPIANISISIPRFCDYTLDDLRHWFGTTSTQEIINILLRGILNSDKATIFTVMENAGLSPKLHDPKYTNRVSKEI